MEISAPGISKATGLAKVCDYLGIQMNEVMAIGDSHNDLHMIQSVGFGIAMDNAEDELKRRPMPLQF